MSPLDRNYKPKFLRSSESRHIRSYLKAKHARRTGPAWYKHGYRCRATESAVSSEPGVLDKEVLSFRIRRRGFRLSAFELCCRQSGGTRSLALCGRRWFQKKWCIGSG